MKRRRTERRRAIPRITLWWMAHRICKSCRSTSDLREHIETIAHERKTPFLAQLHPLIGFVDAALNTTYSTRQVFYCGRCLRWKRRARWLIALAILVLPLVPAAIIFLREGGLP